MADHSFAIVCDDGCDLPSSFLEERGVALVRVPVEKNPAAGPSVSPDAVRVLGDAYARLASEGVDKILSIHSAAALGGLADAVRPAAERVRGVEVAGVDTGSASVATGLVVARASLWRERGTSFEGTAAAARTLARQVRLLVVPSSHAQVVYLRARRTHRHTLGRAASGLRVRISGERCLMLVFRGEVTRLARATDIVELTSRLAHAMSSVSAGEGPLVHAEVEAGDPRVLRAMEKPLDTNEFDSERLWRIAASPSTVALLGRGSVAAAFVGRRAFEADPALLAEGFPETDPTPPEV